MKHITGGHKREIWYIVIDGEEYLRHGPHSWEIRMGESWEPVHFCEEEEDAFEDWFQKENQ